MKYVSLVAIAILVTFSPCLAEAQGNLFRSAFSCPNRGPSSVCIFGKISKATPITLLAKDWKSSGTPKEEFTNTEFENEFKTITRVEVAAPPPREGLLIAALAATETVNALPLKEVRDEALVGRIGAYIKTAQQLNLKLDIRILKTRLLRLSPTILLSETFLATPDNEAALRKELPGGCRDCDTVPMLVGQTLTDLFAGIRSTEVNAVESICGGIRFAFALSGRPYLVSYASSCESDSLSATLIHDLSGKKPKLVFGPPGG